MTNTVRSPPSTPSANLARIDASREQGHQRDEENTPRLRQRAHAGGDQDAAVEISRIEFRSCPHVSSSSNFQNFVRGSVCKATRYASSILKAARSSTLNESMLVTSG